MGARELTRRQQAFINEYLVCWNASKAARLAGYSVKTAGAIGGENLQKPEIMAAIQERLRQLTMSADEALYRLSQIASGSMADFVDPETQTIDLRRAEEAGRLGLLKRFTHTRTDGRESITVELYDAQSALVQIINQQRLTAGEPTSRIEAIVHDDNAPERLAEIAGILASVGRSAAGARAEATDAAHDEVYPESANR